jgi:2,4-diaminopentanoate dehydrogenase
VIQYSTGNVGKHALRGIIERPDFELVGVRVFDPAKVGLDAGQLVDTKPTGVFAVGDFEEILSMSADCVSYNALAETAPGGPAIATDEICQLLRSGKNVVSTSISRYVNPKVLEPELRGRIEDACAAGGTTFFAGGVNPGYAFDLWPIVMSQLSRRIDRIVCSEYSSMEAYTSKSAMAFMGFGLAPDVPTAMDKGVDPHKTTYYAPLLMLGDALRVEFDDILVQRDVAVDDVETVTPAGVYPAGTVVAMRMIFAGKVGGVTRVEYHKIYRVNNEVAPEWGAGDGLWTLDFEGDPNVRCQLEVETQTDAGRPVSITPAMVPLNAIPAVVAAPPGFATHFELGLHSGGYVSTTE